DVPVAGQMDRGHGHVRVLAGAWRLMLANGNRQPRRPAQAMRPLSRGCGQRCASLRGNGHHHPSEGVTRPRAGGAILTARGGEMVQGGIGTGVRRARVLVRAVLGSLLPRTVEGCPVLGHVVASSLAQRPSEAPSWGPLANFNVNVERLAGVFSDSEPVCRGC